jgi:hypothetical protein
VAARFPYLNKYIDTTLRRIADHPSIRIAGVTARLYIEASGATGAPNVGESKRLYPFDSTCAHGRSAQAGKEEGKGIACGVGKLFPISAPPFLIEPFRLRLQRMPEFMVSDCHGWRKSVLNAFGETQSCVVRITITSTPSVLLCFPEGLMRRRIEDEE